MTNPIYVFEQELYSWLTEPCIICSSVNHIFLDHLDADAWECWHCMNRHWFDDAGKIAYMLVHSKTDEEADKDLMEGNIVTLNGQSQR